MKKKNSKSRRVGAAKPKAKSATPEVGRGVEAPLPSRRPAFPIVGIGASAGGLEALELFLKNVPEKSGMAFVIVQHMDPTHKGAMVQLLQRATPLPVVQVADRMRVEPDKVYVIPPNKDMSILHGVLHLLPPGAPRGLNLPIDFFFRSLAEDQKEHSVGVILSGMGSDGTLGLRAIKEHAGAGFVQSLTSAKFDSMPRSAIDADLSDVVAPAEELPAKILAYGRHAVHAAAAGPLLEDKRQSALDKIFILLRTHTGNDFSLYKRSTINRRIERRMGLHQIDRLTDYVRYLRENPRETEMLFKELLIGVTSFFRDPEMWERLKADALPKLVEGRKPRGPIRAWVPGCSTGEEAYSLAMVLREVFDAIEPSMGTAVQIFATDLDRDAIDKARQGFYPMNVAADVSPERLRRFFLKEEHGYRVRKEIRESVVFAPQNIISDPPFTKIDILSCRNLLIYLSPELQRKLIPLFHYALSPGGILFLGSAETVGTFSTLFAPLDTKARLYRRLETPLGTPAVEFPASFVAPAAEAATRAEPEPVDKGKGPASLQTLADHVIVQRFSPAVVLTTEKGDVLYISGRTGKYLEPPVGKANLNIFAMAREGLQYELSKAFNAASRQTRAVTVHGVDVRNNGTIQTIDLTVQKLTEPRELRGTMVIAIRDVPSGKRGGKKVTKRRVPSDGQVPELEKEIARVREELQSTREQMQTSQEELKSTNEELQSTNEELQSTNEELTTSKEEMQSMNEELQTVNHELQAKVDELSRANNDMKNLLNSTDIATLFLDGDLLVRRFTTQTSKLIKLIPADAGRPITDIASNLEYPELADDAREVLRTLVFKEKVVELRRGGGFYAVRIMPYRTLENVIDGVVMTFTDCTTAKQLEAELREKSSELQRMAEALPEVLWQCRSDGSCVYLSPRWVEYTGVPEDAQLGDGWLQQVHEADRERLRREWGAAVDSGTPLDTDIRIRGKDGGYRWFRSRSVPVRDKNGRILKWYGTHADIHKLKQAATSPVQSDN